MPAAELERAGDTAYREALPEGSPSGPPVLCVHGFPQSSRMWAGLIDELASKGRRCIAPDLYCLGESTDPGPATFERNLEALTELVDDLDPEPLALVVHDWGGFVGLAWACEHPERVAALVISDTGFFSDGRWHGMAEMIRGPEGEQIAAAIDREGFAALLRADGAQFSDDDIDAYWEPFASDRGREAMVEFYRSMDFGKLAPYEGKLAALGVPTLILWGAEDEFAPVGGAHRLAEEIPDAELVVIEAAGHFVWETEPERSRREVVGFLGRTIPSG